MKNHNSFIMAFSLLVIMSTLLMASRLSAQLSNQTVQRSSAYSDEILIAFIRAVREVMPLQQQSQMEMIRAIENRELSLERFNKILEANSRGQRIDATSEEMDAFTEIIEAIENIQLEYEDMILEALERKNITALEYQGILADYQQDYELEERINSLMEKMKSDGDL
jgi:hypothetical protein